MPLLVGIDLLVHESIEFGCELACPRRIFEVHGSSRMREMPARGLAPLSAPAENLFDLSPAALSHIASRASRLDRMRTRRAAVSPASHDALGDARGAEHVVGDVEVPFTGIDRAPVEAPAIRCNVIVFRRDPKSGQIESEHAAERAAGN